MMPRRVPVGRCNAAGILRTRRRRETYRFFLGCELVEACVPGLVVLPPVLARVPAAAWNLVEPPVLFMGCLPFLTYLVRAMLALLLVWACVRVQN
jgi:hypothetical protein